MAMLQVVVEVQTNKTKSLRQKKKKKRLNGVGSDSSRPSFCDSPKVIAKKVSTRKI
jgi:hypothetical protein